MLEYFVWTVRVDSFCVIAPLSVVEVSLESLVFLSQFPRETMRTTVPRCLPGMRRKDSSDEAIPWERNVNNNFYLKSTRPLIAVYLKVFHINIRVTRLRNAILP